MSETGRGLRNWALPVGLGVVVLTLVGIALARGPVDLDPDSPEGTVQEYLQAVSDERWEDAIAVLHPALGEGCDADDLRFFGVGEFTAQLGHVDSGGFETDEFFFDEEFPREQRDTPAGTDSVDVTITHGDSFGNGWNEFTVFELVEEDGFYWIVGNPWPHFFWECRGDF